MKLLEIIKGKNTDTSTIAACVNIAKKIGKVSAVAGNCYGFIGNRMLEPYAREAVFLLEEGCTPQQIDKALKSKIGFAMGLFETMDLAGNDVGWRQRIERGLTGNTPAPNIKETREALKIPDFEGMRYCALADKLCEAGHFGQKTGRGWYKYDPTAPRVPIENAETLDLIESYRTSMVCVCILLFLIILMIAVVYK
jgi:3-hydroxyacyl-CoA dehydrogenase